MDNSSVIMISAGATCAGFLIGFAVHYIASHRSHKRAEKAVEEVSEEKKNKAKLEADKIINQAQISAKDELINLRDEFEQSTKEERTVLLDRENKIKNREEKLDSKMDELQGKLDELRVRDQGLLAGEREIQNKSNELDSIKRQHTERLETISEMSAEEAREELLGKLSKELERERGKMIRKSSEEIRLSSDRESQKILIQTMQRFAGECTYERTTSTIQLPSDEMKGRIIGREGRNIRVFEAETGVNLMIDDTPSAVVISCFDPIRRETARLALERLVEDGRIHPTRVEEVVAKCREDIRTEMITAGEDAIHQLQIGDMPAAVVEMIGKLRYRYSFTQNVLSHSIEVANFMGLLAAELGLNVLQAKRAGLLHDIGKAMDHEIEGSHAIIGMDFLRRHGENDEILNAVGSHHGDIPQESLLAVMVNICDTLSASRPGARCETTEIYLKRLEKLEDIGSRFDGVESCYAVQAGREIRIIVEPGEVNEDAAHDMARTIAQSIEAEMQYPGQIKVSVIRESRAVEYAK